MAIKKKPVDQVEKFINEAPDGLKVPRFRRGNKAQITVTMNETLLDQVDMRAKQLGISRAAFISMAVVQVMEAGLHLDGNG
jgi:hypothetical protein